MTPKKVAELYDEVADKIGGSIYWEEMGQGGQKHMLRFADLVARAALNEGVDLFCTARADREMGDGPRSYAIALLLRLSDQYEASE
jgi:hypothetical protein